MKKKLIALLLSFVVVLALALPAALAQPEDGAEGGAPVESGAAQEPAGAEPTPAGEAPDPEGEQPGEPAQPTDPDPDPETGEQPGEPGGEEPDEGEGEQPEEPEKPAEDPDKEPGLYKRVLACQSLEEIETVFAKVTQEEIDALTPEQAEELERFIAGFDPEPAPAVELPENEPPVPSEIVYPTVNFARVAPFAEPVDGGE